MNKCCCDKSPPAFFSRFTFSVSSIAAVLALMVWAPASSAQPQEVTSDKLVEEIITLGTRTKGRTATDLPVPVDVLSDTEMRQTGATEVGRMLQVLALS